MFFSYNIINNYFDHYFFSLFLFNIFSYIFILTNIFIIFFLFDLKYIKTLNELKFLGNNSFFTLYLVLIFLSFVGTPPLLGFISKFLIFNFIFYKKNIYLFFIFILLNFFSMYFYLQNLRFIVSKKLNIKNYLNSNLFFILNFFNFFNLFSIIFFEDFFIFFNYLSSFMNF